jgi:hypothetical protein
MSIVWKAIIYMTGRGLAWGLGLGALYGAVLLMFMAPSGIFYGALYGAIFGAPSGIAAGIVNGVVIGLLTHFYFYPLTDPERYRGTLQWVSAVLTLVGIPIGWGLVMGGNTIGFVLFPALIGSLAAGYAAGQFATRYAEDKRRNDKPKNDEKPKRDEVYA